MSIIKKVPHCSTLNKVYNIINIILFIQSGLGGARALLELSKKSSSVIVPVLVVIFFYSLFLSQSSGSFHNASVESNENHLLCSALPNEFVRKIETLESMWLANSQPMIEI